MDVVLATYLSEFNHKLLEAGGQDWDDIIKINMLFKNLNFQLHNQSIEHSKPSTYSKFCTDLHLLNNNLSQFHMLQNHRGFYQTNTYTPNHSAAPPASKSEPMN
ncbi:pol-like protein [Histoplasma ohiense]|nr:pol-like protein [Histoplasma ohiense (nom. inval.)]